MFVRPLVGAGERLSSKIRNQSRHLLQRNRGDVGEYVGRCMLLVFQSSSAHPINLPLFLTVFFPSCAQMFASGLITAGRKGHFLKLDKIRRYQFAYYATNPFENWKHRNKCSSEAIYLPSVWVCVNDTTRLHSKAVVPTQPIQKTSFLCMYTFIWCVYVEWQLRYARKIALACMEREKKIEISIHHRQIVCSRSLVTQLFDIFYSHRSILFQAIRNRDRSKKNRIQSRGKSI